MRRWLGILAALVGTAPAQAAWVAPGRLAWPAGGPVGYERQPHSKGVAEPDGSVILAIVDRGRVDVRHVLADGTEDAAFGANGVARLALPAGTESATARPFLGPGGRILVAVAVQKRFHGSGLVLALTAAGKPDPSYGQEGQATAAFYPNAMAAGADGTIVLGGAQRHRAVIARLDPDGAPGGVTLVPGLTGHDASADTVAVLDDGRMLVLGATGRSTRALVRLRPDGTPDPAFNDGRPLIPHVHYAFALATLPDGTAAIAGTGAIARITPAGALDTTFGPGGRVDTGLADNGEFWQLQASGDAIYAWRPRAYPPLPESRPNFDLHTLDADGLSPAHPVPLPFAGGFLFDRPEDSFETDQLLPRPGGGWLAIGSTKIIEAHGHDTSYEETATFQAALAALTPDLALDAPFGGMPTALSCAVTRIARLAPPDHPAARITFSSTVPGIATAVVRTTDGARLAGGQLAAYVAGRNAGGAAANQRLRSGQRVTVRLRIVDIFGRHATCAAPLTVR